MREKSWVFFEILLPLLATSAFVFVYRALQAPAQYIGFVVIGGAMIVGVNLLVDILYAFIDPRIRLEA